MRVIECHEIRKSENPGRVGVVRAVFDHAVQAAGIIPIKVPVAVGIADKKQFVVIEPDGL